MPRRGARWRRRLAGLGCLVAPGAWIALADVGRRLEHLATFDRLHLKAYAATVIVSAALWGVLIYVASRRRGLVRDLAAGLFVAGITLTVGVQSAFFSLYDTYFSHDSAIYARSFPRLLWAYLPLHRPGVLLRLVATTAFAVALVAVSRRFVRPRPWPRRLVPLLIPGALYGVTQVPASYRLWQSTTPDLIYVHGLVSNVKERLRLADDAPDFRVQVRTPLPVPRLTAQPARPRNVLFILQESLRSDVVCNGYEPDALPDDGPPLCATPFSNAAVPRRHAFDQLRANASTTAISISNLWSGVAANASYETLMSAPLLWDFASAAGYHGAYWTSQHVMFGSMRLYVQDLPTEKFSVATQLDKKADFDAGANDDLLTQRVIDDWAALPEPFFAVVHYSNVHFPYVYDPAHAPFQPALFSKAADKNREYFNYYKDVAYLSDRAVGRLLEHVRQSDKSDRTVVVYTSDHGESFREHWEMGHTSALYDEEIKVPGWLDAPEGSLSEAERASLVTARTQFVWHYDLHATMLDLLGVWDAPELVPFRRSMLGHPLTRPERTTTPVPLSNCSWLWECAFRNWGMMQGSRKIEAREWDHEFHCFDLLADPNEALDLGERACAPLPELARGWFGEMPAAAWPRGKDVLYGPPPKSPRKR
ncbi:MAG: sulfatase-like hydrolase/transferase [Deltaproteobacteria bacterium]|nr:sulfatase-like hydrolase/transferase [Deltaproteobacteria bacterium]